MKIAYLFSSYNFKYKNYTPEFNTMRRKWFDKSKYVRECFKYASEVLNYNVIDFLNNSTNKIYSQTNAEITYFIFSYAMYKHLSNTYKINSEYLMGFGFGEVAALCAAEAISFSDGLKYVQKVSKLLINYQENGGSVDVTISDTNVNEITKMLDYYNREKESLKVISSSYLGETILSGELNQIINFLKYLKSKKKITEYLYYDYHDNEEYNKLVEYTKEISNQIKCSDINRPVIYSLKSRLYNNSDDINKALSELLFFPVNINNCLKFLNSENIDCYIEVSAGNVIKNIIDDKLSDICSFSVADDNKEIKDYMKYVESNILTIPEMCISVASTTKNINNNAEEYKKGVVQPYMELKKICNKNTLSKKTAQKALDLLSMILKTKGLPLSEINRLINSIIKQSNYKNLLFNGANKG